MNQPLIICFIVLICYILYLHYQSLFHSKIEESFEGSQQQITFVSILKPFEKTQPKLWKETHEKIQYMIKALKKSIYLANTQNPLYINSGGRFIDIAKIYADEAIIRYNAMRGFHECDSSILEPDNDMKKLTDFHIQKAKIHWNDYCNKHINHTVSFQNTDGVQPYDSSASSW